LISGQEQEFFFFPKCADRPWGHQPLIEGASEVVSAGVNQYGPESEHV